MASSMARPNTHLRHPVALLGSPLCRQNPLLPFLCVNWNLFQIHMRPRSFSFTYPHTLISIPTSSKLEKAQALCRCRRTRRRRADWRRIRDTPRSRGQKCSKWSLVLRGGR
eukprot:2387801-Amphidinium_carterae.1